MRNPLLIILLLFSIAACAHAKDTLKNAQAYYYLRVPGTIAVDRDGKPLTGPTSMFVIYLEAKDSVKGAHVRIRGKEYTPAIDLVKTIPAQIGIRRTNQKSISLQPAPGYKLWRLSVSTNRLDGSPEETTDPKEIIVSGTVNNKSFLKNIREVTELEAQLYQ